MVGRDVGDREGSKESCGKRVGSLVGCSRAETMLVGKRDGDFGICVGRLTCRGVGTELGRNDGIIELLVLLPSSSSIVLGIMVARCDGATVGDIDSE